MKQDEYKNQDSEGIIPTEKAKESFENKKKRSFKWKTINTTTHPKMLALHDGFGSKDFDRFYKNITVIIEEH